MKLRSTVLLVVSLTAWPAVAQLPLLGAGAGPTGGVFSTSLSDSVATTTALGMSNGLNQVINVTVVTSDTVSAAFGAPQGMGDIASGFTEWHSVGDAYTAAYATPGTNLSATAIGKTPGSETCSLQVAASGGPGQVTSCSAGSSGQLYSTWTSGATEIAIFDTSTLVDQTGNGHSAVGCFASTCPNTGGGGGAGGFPGVNLSAVAGMLDTIQFTATSTTVGQGLRSGLTNFSTPAGTLVWRAYQNVSTFNDGVNFYWFLQGNFTGGGHFLYCGKSASNAMDCGWYNGGTSSLITTATTATIWPAAGWHLYAVRWDVDGTHGGGTAHTDWVVDGVVQATNSSVAPQINNVGVTLNFGGDSYSTPQRYSTYSLCEWGFNPTYISDANLASMASGTTCH